MGGLCSRSSSVNNAPSGTLSHGNGDFHHAPGLAFDSREPTFKGGDNLIPPSFDKDMEKQLREPFSFRRCDVGASEIHGGNIDEGIPYLSRVFSHKSRTTGKVSEVSSLLGKAGTVGFGKAVEVLDTLGSSMTSLGGGFGSTITIKGNKISILAFEVANTVVKGANLLQSLSKENVKHLKEVVLLSEGVRHLISKDMNELFYIAATDKRDELKIFAGEVVRFGNRCRDPQWHNLDRYFEKLGSENTPRKQFKEAELMIQQLMILVRFTAELYHESNVLDRFEQDYRRKLHEEDNSTTAQRGGESIALLRSDLKNQRKHVRSLKKKSLWGRILEEVMEKLVEIVEFLHMEINEAFGYYDDVLVQCSNVKKEKLGSAGLALHYANIITQIDTLVTRSTSIPPNSRDALYQGLPPAVKSGIRVRLLSFQPQELTVLQVKAEMEKTLRWLVPVASNTTKAHHGFGWVGEWANTGSENRKAGDLTRIETLYHAYREETESHILELLLSLHHLVLLAKSGKCGSRSPIKSPVCTLNTKPIPHHLYNPYGSSPHPPTLTPEDRQMLRDVCSRRTVMTPGISKSQELDTDKAHSHAKNLRLSKSSSHSPSCDRRFGSRSGSRSGSRAGSRSGSGAGSGAGFGCGSGFVRNRRQHFAGVIDFHIDRIKALDVIDRVDSISNM